MLFPDYFSQNAANYARYRPQYPKTLFDYLSHLVEEQKAAWDCGTGNGQVACELTDYFEKVYASDASEEQIKQARIRDRKALQAGRIDYFISLAESTPLEANSIDLITVAQAFHWFKAEAFYEEVKQVLKPNGIIALWCYGLFDIPDAAPSLNIALQEFRDAVEPFWTQERQLVNTGYQTVPFPFNEITPPHHVMTHNWSAEELIGYLNTWSSTQRYIQSHGNEKLFRIAKNIAQEYPDAALAVNFPLSFRIGRASQP